MEHQRKQREKQSEIDMLRDKLRDAEARVGYNIDEAKAF